MKCPFYISPANSKCGEELKDGEQYCRKHKHYKCHYCKEQANRLCSVVGCSIALCDKCKCMQPFNVKRLFLLHHQAYLLKGEF